MDNRIYKELSSIKILRVSRNWLKILNFKDYNRYRGKLKIKMKKCEINIYIIINRKLLILKMLNRNNY